MTDRLSDAALDAAGLDTAAGIERLGGDSQLYLSLLYKFKTEHRDDMRNLQECREKNDYDAVYKMVHTLQSVTGNIAAREVSEQMHIILKAMKEKVPLQSVGKDLDRVSADFNALLTAIDRLPDSVFKDFSRPEGSMRTGRRDELMAYLLDLSRYF
ncbi:MAG: Hpt domain-containing protein [Spirochaetales bacterium]|nr:Hpt domain-containing protein [Spirochaetales bacterium]